MKKSELLKHLITAKWNSSPLTSTKIENKSKPWPWEIHKAIQYWILTQTSILSASSSSKSQLFLSIHNFFFHWWCILCLLQFVGSPVLGYLAAGILIGPYGLSIIRHVHGTKAIAEFGVVFLLFNIGLEVESILLRHASVTFLLNLTRISLKRIMYLIWIWLKSLSTSY